MNTAFAQCPGALHCPQYCYQFTAFLYDFQEFTSQRHRTNWFRLVPLSPWLMAHECFCRATWTLAFPSRCQVLCGPAVEHADVSEMLKNNRQSSFLLNRINVHALQDAKTFISTQFCSQKCKNSVCTLHWPIRWQQLLSSSFSIKFASILI